MEIENSLALGETADEAVEHARRRAQRRDRRNGRGRSCRRRPTCRPRRRWTSSPTRSSTSRRRRRRSSVLPVRSATRATSARRSTTLASRSARRSRQSVVEIRSSSPSTTSSRRARGTGPSTPTPATGRARRTTHESARPTALRDWVAAVLPTYTAPAVEDVFLVGDFNSYTQEDPLQVLYAAGLRRRQCTARRVERVLVLVLRSERIARPRARQRLGDGPRRPAPTSGTSTLRSRSPSSTAATTTTARCSTTTTPFRSSDHDPVIVAFTPLRATGDGRPDVARHQRLPRSHRRRTP